MCRRSAVSVIYITLMYGLKGHNNDLYKKYGVDINLQYILEALEPNWLIGLMTVRKQNTT